MSQILRAETLIQGTPQATFNAAAEPVTSLGRVTKGRVNKVQIDKPDQGTAFTVAVTGASYITCDMTGMLTIDLTSQSFPDQTVVPFTVEWSKGAVTTKVYYNFIFDFFKMDIVYFTPGTYSYIVPSYQTTMGFLAIGAGGGGATAWSTGSGGGGCLAFNNSFAVTPGEIIEIVVPPYAPKLTSSVNAKIGDYFTCRSGTHLQNAFMTVKVAGSINCTGGGQGGHVYGNRGGGGGAGGYGDLPDGSDGRGGESNYGASADGLKGAAAGGNGYNSSTYGFGGGGGVGFQGRGSSGVGRAANASSNNFNNNYWGRPGSGGQQGQSNTNTSSQIANTYPKTIANATRLMYHGDGGDFGGGAGGSGTSVSNSSSFCKGAQGLVRIFGGATGINYPLVGGTSSTTILV
jgi:hypothetical protein